MVCVVGRMRDLILQLSKSSIYSTKPPIWYGIVISAFFRCPISVLRTSSGQQNGKVTNGVNGYFLVVECAVVNGRASLPAKPNHSATNCAAVIFNPPPVRHSGHSVQSLPP
uniref:Uncharacterized protein n=1 Tax=Escherichia coli TaxID=562 RepID=A0A1X9QAG0_ECOLX|nr:hypothetical protein [Escherichia coli]